MTQHLRLIEPTSAWQSPFLDLAAEFAAHNDLRYQAACADFDAYLARLQQFARGTNLSPGHVPQTTYWGVDGPVIVGCIRWRHQLTPALQQIGGHIGYEVRPSKRGQGYGTQLLGLALNQAWTLEFPRVLITCDIDNVGSVRIIEKNGGKLIDQGRVAGHDKVVLRYWIDRPAGA